MLNNSVRFFITSILLLFYILSSQAQTTSWRVVWKRNPISEKILYYIVYKKVDSQPSAVDSIGYVTESPNNPQITSTYHIDNNISPGVHYYYRVQAVDSLKNRSALSQALDAGIPKILISSPVTIPSGQPLQINLNNPQNVADPDHSASSLTWHISGGNQINVSVNASNVATITSPAGLSVSEIFEFSVVDPDSFYDVKSVTITAITNDPPLFVSQPPTTALQGTLYEYTVIAHDPEGDALNFALSESPNFLTINTLNDSMALISGIPGSNHVGNHMIEISVDDGINNPVTQSYQLHVSPSSSGGSFHSSVQVSYPQPGLVRITWQTRDPSQDYIDYGPDANYGSTTTKDLSYTTQHDQILSGLQSNALYHYQITSETETEDIYKSADSTFMTQPVVEVKAYPIPYNTNDPNPYGGINFEFPLQAESYNLNIYSLVGDLVFSVKDLSQSYVWKIVNSSGKEVNAGLYIYVVNDNKNEKIASGKLVIIR